jgi:hypothetical protein
MKVYPIVITLLVAADSKREAKALAHEDIDGVVYGTMEEMHVTSSEPAGIVDYTDAPCEDDRDVVKRKIKNVENVISKAMRGED